MFHSGRFRYLGMEAIINGRGYQTLEDAGDIGGNHNSSFGVDEPATVARMLAWIDGLPRGQRFFLTYLPIAGHHPYATPEHGPFAGTAEIDAAGGIVMPGMIDTHRHMWQTAMRGYGADWTLTQYFVWYYLQWGKVFRPQDIYAGNLLAAIEAIDAGVTTTVDWSHGLQTVEHAEAAVDALEEVPGRFVLAYGNIQQGPWEWSAAPEFGDFVRRRVSGGSDMLGFQMAFDVTGDPAFPERAAFEVARDLGVAVTTHAGVWGATNDDGIRLMHENGFMTDRGDRRIRLGVDRE